MTLTLRLVLATALTIAAAAGCSNEPTTPTAVATPTSAAITPATSAPASVTPSASPIDVDEQGRLACKLVESANEDGTLRDARVIAKITKAAAGSDNASIRIAGQLLSDRYELARESRGTSDEFSTSLDVKTQALDMELECVDSGLEAP